MRTQNEIVAKIEAIKKADLFRFKTDDLICWLDYEHAKPYLLPEVTADQWTPTPSDRESILKAMRDYMAFAWDKANGCRGLSASRSMAHYSMWIWMLGDEEIFGDLENYEHYGKENLLRICQHYGWESNQWDDGVRVNSDNYENTNHHRQ